MLDDPTTENFMMVVRYGPGGALDTDFGSNGIARAAFATDSNAGGEEVSVQPNGRIVVSGQEFGHEDPAVARFMP
jgi:hypothetical protein